MTGAIETLAALGYRSTPRVPVVEQWRRFARSGEVTAVSSSTPWTWRTANGTLLHADAGDWRVSDGEQVWSVAAEVFLQTYRHLSGDRFERVGEVSGRPAVAGEVINSLEGDQLAAAGDWVLRGPAGEEWLVGADHLAHHYRPLDSPVSAGRDGPAGSPTPRTPPAG